MNLFQDNIMNELFKPVLPCEELTGSLYELDFNNFPFSGIKMKEPFESNKEEKEVLESLTNQFIDPLSYQPFGSHYKDCKIQPIEYIEANNLKFLEGSIIKRITRHNKPTGKGRQDIEKIIHECRLLLKFRYGEDNDNL